MKRNIEDNRIIRSIEIVAIIILLAVSGFSYVKGIKGMNAEIDYARYDGKITMHRDKSDEEYDDTYTMCDVTYINGEEKLIASYPYEEYLLLGDEIEAYRYVMKDGTVLLFDHLDPSKEEMNDAYRERMADELNGTFNFGTSSLILAIAIGVILLFGKRFNAYEKIWFVSVMILAGIFAAIFPEESANGVNGIVIMLLYLLDTFLNVLCELLISKQSRYNFLVSVLVEITEIAMSLVLMYRFATMAVTLLFWLPIDIISFISWSRHRDDEDDELTIVRRLKGYQEMLIVLAIVVWTIVVGYIISGLDIRTDFLKGRRELETAIIYLDACASAVGIANGLFIFFRLREQWLAWYLCALLEAIINVLSGQYVLLILKLAYFTNTTYGYIKWTRYIREHQTDTAQMQCNS